MTTRENRKKHEKKPLWRKVNTCTYNVHHRSSFKEYERGKKEDLLTKSKMTIGRQHGIDLTPLFGFLRKNAGKKWDLVKSEALSRLPEYFSRNDPFEYSLISLEEFNDLTEDKIKTCFFRYGESTYFSMLYIDKEGVLQLVNPNWNVTDLKPYCHCCTHTLNGKEVPRHLYPKI